MVPGIHNVYTRKITVDHKILVADNFPQSMLHSNGKKIF